MVMPDKNRTALNGRNTKKGGTTFDKASWDEVPREDLLRLLQNMVMTAPRAAAEEWRDSFLLPLLAQKKQEGGMQTSA